MESLETVYVVRRARDGNKRGHHPVTAAVESLPQDRIIHGKEAPHPVGAGCGGLGEGLWWGEAGGVDSVHTWGFGSGRTPVGLGRIPHVS